MRGSAFLMGLSMSSVSGGACGRSVSAIDPVRRSDSSTVFGGVGSGLTLLDPAIRGASFLCGVTGSAAGLMTSTDTTMLPPVASFAFEALRPNSFFFTSVSYSSWCLSHQEDRFFF